MKFLFPLLTILVCLSGCVNSQETNTNEIKDEQTIEKDISNPLIEDRDSILILLKNKIARNEPLIVHAFVALLSCPEICLQVKHTIKLYI